MDGGIAQKVRDLCEVHVIFPDQLSGKIDLHMRKKVDHSAAVFLTEDFLKLGSSDEIVMADCFKGKGFTDMILQITGDPPAGRRFK